MHDWHIRKELKIMKKEFTAWDTFIIGLNMFVLGMWLVHITNGSSDGVGTSRYVSELVVVLFKISEWFMVVWMIGLFGMATYTYMKNRKVRYDSDSECQEDDVIILVVRDSNGNMLLLGNKFKDVIRNGNGIFIMDG